MGDASQALRTRLLARSGLAADIVTPARLEALLCGLAREHARGGAEEAALRALGDDAEFARVEAHFTPPETWLFRYPRSFERLRAFAAERAATPMRVLVLGAGGWCEPLSISAALARQGGGAVRILATDRNPVVFARPPRFEGLDLRGSVPAWAEPCFEIQPCFEIHAAALSPKAHITSSVRTECGEASEIAAALLARGERFELVAFRNVAIYLSAAARAAIYGVITQLLAPDGMLLVGHAELAMAHAATGFAIDDAEGAFALRPRPGAGSARPPAGSPSAPSAAIPFGSTAEDAPRVAGVEADRSWTPAAHSSPPAAHASPPAARGAGAPRPSADARAALLAAIAARPLEVPVHLALAAHDLEAGAIASASESIARALYLDRGSEEALLLAARIADATGSRDEAEAYRRRALRVHLARPQEDGRA